MAVAIVLLIGCSGGLEGERVSEPVRDWSFVADARDVAFETESGRSFRAVLASPVVHEGALYLDVSTIFTLSDRALEEVLAGGGLRMQAEGKVYPLSATRLTKRRDVDPILPAVVRASGMEATGARWDPNPERYPGTQMRRWFFRLESPAAGTVE